MTAINHLEKELIAGHRQIGKEGKLRVIES
jgi:hypothetical protein